MAGRMGPGPCPPQSDAESYDEGLLLNSPGAASRWPSRIPLFMLPQARLLRSVLANVSRAGASKGRASSSGVHVATSSNDMATDTTEREAPLAFHLPQEEVPLHGEHSPGWDQKRSGAMEQRPLTPPMEEHTAGMRGSAGPAAPRPRRCTSPGTHGGGSSARVHARAERAGQRPGQLLIERVPGISSTTTPAAHVANRRVLGARVAAGAVGSSGPRASGTAPPRLVLHATHAATQAAEALGTRGRGAMPSASPSPALSCEKRQVAGGAPFTTPNKNDAGTLRWEGDARRGGREGELGAMVKELEEEREEMRRVLVGKEEEALRTHARLADLEADAHRTRDLVTLRENEARAARGACEETRGEAWLTRDMLERIGEEAREVRGRLVEAEKGGRVVAMQLAAERGRVLDLEQVCSSAERRASAAAGRLADAHADIAKESARADAAEHRAKDEADERRLREGAVASVQKTCIALQRKLAAQAAKTADGERWRGEMQDAGIRQEADLVAALATVGDQEEQIRALRFEAAATARAQSPQHENAAQARLEKEVKKGRERERQRATKLILLEEVGTALIKLHSDAAASSVPQGPTSGPDCPGRRQDGDDLNARLDKLVAAACAKLDEFSASGVDEGTGGSPVRLHQPSREDQMVDFGF